MSLSLKDPHTSTSEGFVEYTNVSLTQGGPSPICEDFLPRPGETPADVPQGNNTKLVL